MKRCSCFLLATVLLLIALFLSNPPPARASSSLSPGFYTGLVYFSARKDIIYNPTLQGGTGEGSEVEKVVGRGQLMVKINDAGAGGVSIVLPTTTRMDFHDKVTVDTGGYCTTDAWLDANANFVHLRGDPAAMGDIFQFPVNLTTGLHYTDEAGFAYGENMPTCPQSYQGALDSMKPRMKIDLSVVTALQLNVRYHSGIDMGGDCTLPGWIQTVTYQGGKNVYTVGECYWWAVKSTPGSPQKGWK